MGIVSNEEFESELNNSARNGTERNTVKIPEIIVEEEKKKGRGEGNVEVPNSLRKLIGDASVSDGRGEALDLANHFGISPSSVSAYSNGSTSTKSYDKKVNGNVINQAKQRIYRRARNRINLAFNHITEERLRNANLKTVSSVAKDMSMIIKNMESSGDNKVTVNNDKPTFVFYSPQLKQESDFEAITVKE